MRLSIALGKDTSEEVSTCSKAVTGLPQKLKPRLIHPQDVISVVVTMEEEAIETHGSKEGCLGVRVAKGIYLPGYPGPGLRSKCVLQELKT